MRSALLCCVLLLMAGCAAPSAPDSVDGSSPSESSLPHLPPDMEEEITYTGAFEAAGAAADGPCSLQPWCFDYPFEVGPAGATVLARLSWTVPANDLDLLLLREDAVVASAQGRGPGGEETLEAVLEPGSYRLRVVPYAVLDEPDAVLRATFQAADSS